MAVGIYARALRSFVKNEHQKIVLEFWANNRQEEDDWIVLDNLRNPGQLTACHNIASNFVDNAGTGALTTAECSTGAGTAQGAQVQAAIQAVQRGGCVMQIKFHEDHSVLLISSVGDAQVELLEGWAGAGAALGSNPPYPFTSSVYQDYEAGRLSKADVAGVLANVANRTDLQINVQRLTRGNATMCGIGKNPFKLTLKYKALDTFGVWSMASEQAVAKATRTIAHHVHAVAAQGGDLRHRCCLCFLEKPTTRPLINAMWHDCPTCGQSYCGDCGAAQPRPPGEGAMGTTALNRHRQCAAGHTMTMF